jgi:uncharacterized protein (TIGR00255 family)
MTGFGKATGTGSLGEEIVVEVRSFNSKTLKLSIRIPSPFLPFEEEVRSLVRQYIRRGSVNLTARVTSKADDPEIRINTTLMETYASALKALGERLSLETRIDLAELAGLPGAVELMEPDREASREEVEALLSHVEAALKQHEDSRRVEGKNLATDLRERAQATLGFVDRIRARAPKVVEAYRERLAARIEELLDGTHAVPPESLQTEVAIFAERSDIHEECVRAGQHLQTFLKILGEGGELGRRLDFIAQEIYRELNTIMAKANDYDISQLAVDGKAEIDKIKEQIQNVE